MRRSVRETQAAIAVDIQSNLDRARDLVQRTDAILMTQGLTMAKLQGELTRQAAIAGKLPGLVAVARQVEEQRAKGKVRAAAMGHPEWSNACIGCGCRLHVDDGEHCEFCTLMRLLA